MQLMFQNDFSGFPHRSPYFVGREKLLIALSSAFSGGARTAAILGMAGVGKTQLAVEFIYRNSSFFPGGFAVHYAHAPLPIEGWWEEAKNWKFPKQRCILLVNDAENIEPDGLIALNRMLHLFPNLCIILTSRRRIELSPRIDLSISLLPLSPYESASLLQNHLGEVPQDAFKQLNQLAQGHPIVIELAARMIKEGQITWQEFFNRLRSFEYPGIVGIDGRPLSPGMPEERRIIVDAAGVNDELIRRLKSDPELLRLISPRRFEEIIADIMSRMGYEVSLTPASRDGGFDLYAAKNNELGAFLFLVECKKYIPPNRVGVEIVRSLHGVVQSKKATAGVIATTSFFTSPAKEFQKEVAYQLQLRDYIDLQQWLNQIRC